MRFRSIPQIQEIGQLKIYRARAHLSWKLEPNADGVSLQNPSYVLQSNCQLNAGCKTGDCCAIFMASVSALRPLGSPAPVNL